MLKTWILGLSLTVVFLPPLLGQSPAPETSSPDQKVSIDVVATDLGLIVQVLNRLSGINVQYESDAFNGTRPVTVHWVEQAWQPALQSLLSEQGLVLWAKPDGSNAYSIIKAKNPTVALRVQFAQDGVAMAEAALADIRTNNVPSATARLQIYADDQRKILKTFVASQEKPEKGSANRMSESSFDPAPQGQR
ncbi:MAG: hypothetical protein WCP86_01500 [bacterium]